MEEEEVAHLDGLREPAEGVLARHGRTSSASDGRAQDGMSVSDAWVALEHVAKAVELALLQRAAEDELEVHLRKARPRSPLAEENLAA